MREQRRKVWRGAFVGAIAAMAMVAATGAERLRAETTRVQVARPEPTMLPDVPIVMASGAQGSTGKSLPAQGRWLLVHVQANCAPCDALLARIGTEAPAVVPRLAIVVAGAGAEDVARLAAATNSLAAAAWFGDENGGLAAALQIQEAPVIMAMSDRAVQWTLSGVLGGSQRLRDVLTGWVTMPGD